jgi:putative ABC transport system permease protein
MTSLVQIIGASFFQALHELRANRLRTFLSLLGVTIGIFCIIAVLSVLDSMKMGIQKNMAALGSDVLYVGRWPWTHEEGVEYKWWEYWKRPAMSLSELNAVNKKVPGAAYVTLCVVPARMQVKYRTENLTGVEGYAVTTHFDRMQMIEIAQGRYLSNAELDGGAHTVVLGNEIYKGLFGGNVSPLGKSVSFLGRNFVVVGILKKVGQTMTGFDFDNAVVFSYATAASLFDVRSLNNDPLMMIKAVSGYNVNDLQAEVEGVLRTERRIKPGETNNFSINKLSQITKQIDSIFGMIDVVGMLIGGLSLLVGAFGIANIMFVTVKERTRIIGLKKAIGAKPSVILSEFLIEAITLCILGGLIGIFIVLLISLAVTHFTDFEIFLSFKNFLIGITVSAWVGVLAGFIPARAASRLDPVVAIRST